MSRPTLAKNWGGVRREVRSEDRSLYLVPSLYLFRIPCPMGTSTDEISTAAARTSGAHPIPGPV